MKFIECGVFLLLGVSVHAQTWTNVNSCNDGSIFPVVRLTGKNDVLCVEPPCPVTPGSDINLDVIFKSPRYLANIKPNIKASSLGVNLDYPLFQDNACDGIVNTYCPIVQNENVQYHYTMHLLNVFPEVEVGLKFTILDEDTNTNVLCFNLDIVVVKDKD